MTTNAQNHPFAAQLQEHGYHLHGLAALFPPMQPEEFEALKESIRQNGQREPALLFGSLLLDGVHRVRACIELGIEPKIVKVAGTGAELRSRVLDLNLHRRHLSVGQRAMIAADLAQRRPGEGGDADDAAPTQAEAAAMMSVGERSVRQAKKIAAEAAPEVVEGVRTGEVTLNAAAGMMDRSGLVSLKAEAEEQRLYDPANQHQEISDAEAGEARAFGSRGERQAVKEEPPPADTPPAEEPTYTYECFLCGDALGEDEVEWLNELPCCPTCHAQAEPDDLAAEIELPEGWEWDGVCYARQIGGISYQVYEMGNGFDWGGGVKGNFSISPQRRLPTLALACAAAEDWHRVWIVAAHGEATNALIDTPAAYSTKEWASDRLNSLNENEFMGEMGAGESLDDVVGV